MGTITKLKLLRIFTTPGYNGMLTDQVTGNQFLGNGYRAYNPRLRLFMKYDSLSPFAEGGINGYAYSDNNPIMAFDPSGHMSKWSKINLGVSLGLSAIGSGLAIMATGGAATPVVLMGYTDMLSVSAIALGAATPVIADSVANAGTGKNWAAQMKSTGWKHEVVGFGTLAIGGGAGSALNAVGAGIATQVVAGAFIGAGAQEGLSYATGLQKGFKFQNFFLNTLQNFGTNLAFNVITHAGIHATMPKRTAIPEYNGKSLNLNSDNLTLEDYLSTKPIDTDGMTQLNDEFKSWSGEIEPSKIQEARINFFNANRDKFTNTDNLVDFENVLSLYNNPSPLAEQHYAALADWVKALRHFP